MSRHVTARPRKTCKKKIEKPTDWAVVFDLFTSEYGWDTDRILTLTQKELFWRLKAIYERLGQKNKFMASLQGVTLKESSSSESQEITEDQQAKIDAHLKARMQDGRN